MSIICYNIEMRMTEADAQHWHSLLVSAREAFNYASVLVTEAKAPLSLKDIHKVCYAALRENFPALPSQCCIKVQQELLGKLKSIKSNKHKNAKAPQKQFLSLVLDKRLYGRLSSEGITLTSASAYKRTLVPFNLYPKVEEMFRNHLTSDPTIFERDGRFFLSVPFNVEGKPCSNNVAVGVDLGMKRFFVTSEGNAFVDKEYLARRRKLRYLKRCLQKKGTSSAKRHLKNLAHKEYFMSKDMCYRAANVLLKSTDASVIVLEDLKKIKQKTSKTEEGFKRKTHNRAFAQVPFYMFRVILEHKALLYGKKAATVSPVFTSQTDCRSGKRDGKRHGCRYICADGTMFDADFNAAVNICQKMKLPVSTRMPIDGTLALIGTAQSTAESFTA